jgi:hypothetical protein
MRFLTVAVALTVLLQPDLALAQCESEDWFTTTSVLSPGLFAQAPFSPIVLFSASDQSFYVVLPIQTSDPNTIDVDINGIVTTEPSCWPGKASIVHRINADGQLIWHRHICYTTDGIVNGLAVDNDGSLYIGGFFKGNLQFEGNTIAQSTNVATHYTVKIDEDGDFAWERSGQRANSSGHIWTDHGLMVFVEVLDSTTFAGQTYYHQNPTTPPTTEIVILMVDANGQVMWDRQITGFGNKSVLLTSEGGGTCLIQGIYAHDISYDGQAFTNGGGKLYQIAINTGNGNRLWMKSQDNNGGARTYGSEFLDDGTIITAGHYIGSPSVFSFQGQTISSSNGLTDGFIMRQDANTGELLWLKTLGAAGYSSIIGITKTATGVALTGFFNSPELNYEGITLDNHNEGTEDPFLVIIDKDGKPQCHVEAIGTEADDRGVKVVQASNYLYTLISFADSTAFGEFELEAQGLYDYAFWKTCLPCDTLTSITEATTAKPSLHLHPNPATHTVRLQVSGSRFQVQSLAITDMLGHAVLRLPLVAVGETELDISSLASGIYTVAATLQGGQVLRERLVVGR